MSLLQTVVGVDPSGRRLALAALGRSLGHAVPPSVFPLRGDREGLRMEEAESILRDFVARNGLAGGAARLCVPTDHVYIARVSFPPLRERDLGPALEIELERLFPFPASRLLFGWRRLGKAVRGKESLLIVAAAPAEYVEPWRDLVSRAGLILTRIVPAGWALSAALSAASGADEPGVTAVLRELGDGVECTLLEGRDPFFGSFRRCAPEAAPKEGIELIRSGLADAAWIEPGTPVGLVAPAAWLRDAALSRDDADVPFRAVEDFEARAARALALPEGVEGPGGPWEALGAFGAAIDDRGIDLSSRPREEAAPRLAPMLIALLAAVCVLLAVAWPAATLWKTRQELLRLDGEIAALRPRVAHVEEALTDLADVEERVGILCQAAAGREEALMILRELTDRLPQGTWLTGLRVESRKVEMDGLSSSAAGLFPSLTRDGRFFRVEFASPITRQPDNIERFQIRSEYAPASEAAGRGAR